MWNRRRRRRRKIWIRDAESNEMHVRWTQQGRMTAMWRHSAVISHTMQSECNRAKYRPRKVEIKECVRDGKRRSGTQTTKGSQSPLPPRRVIFLNVIMCAATQVDSNHRLMVHLHMDGWIQAASQQGRFWRHLGGYLSGFYPPPSAKDHKVSETATLSILKWNNGKILLKR